MHSTPRQTCRSKESSVTQKTLKKKGRGTVDHVVDVNSGVAIVQWLDNNAVHLMSNDICNELGTQTKRWDKKQKKFVYVDRPRIVEDHNQYGWCGPHGYATIDLSCTTAYDQKLHAYILLFVGYFYQQWLVAI